MTSSNAARTVDDALGQVPRRRIVEGDVVAVRRLRLGPARVGELRGSRPALDARFDDVVFITRLQEQSQRERGRARDGACVVVRAVSVFAAVSSSRLRIPRRHSNGDAASRRLSRHRPARRRHAIDAGAARGERAIDAAKNRRCHASSSPLDAVESRLRTIRT